MFPLIACGLSAYKPVILMHGVGSSHDEMTTIVNTIDQEHPGTVATSLPLYENDASFLNPLDRQVKGVAAAIRKMVAENETLYADGWNMVCKSQGGLICRCVIEEMSDHKVDTFVSLAGPQMGVYGPDFFASIHMPGLENFTAKSAWLIAYNPIAQNTISDLNMWRDPFHLPEFYRYDKFLSGYTDNATATMKENFLRLKKAVFCVGSGSPYDGGIEPWQTGVWGFKDSTGNMLSMQQQPVYLQDTFGLKTLDQSGRLNLTIVPGVRHGDWTGNTDVIKKWVIPHLN